MEVDFDLHCGKKIPDNRHEADIRKQDVSQSLQTPTFRNWLCAQELRLVFPTHVTVTLTHIIMYQATYASLMPLLAVTTVVLVHKLSQNSQ